MRVAIAVCAAVVFGALLFKFALVPLLVIAAVVLLVSPLMTSGKGDRNYRD